MKYEHIRIPEGGARIDGALQIPFALVCEQIGMTSLRKESHPPAEPEHLDPAKLDHLIGQLAELRDLVKGYGALAARAEGLSAATVELKIQ